MKKIFTLIAMALVAMSVNAKTVVELNKPAGVTTQFSAWGWQDWYVPSTGEAVVSGSTADDSGITYFDASAYDYLVLKYKECTMETAFILQTSCKGTAGQWGAEFNQCDATIQANTSGLVGIKLDATKNKVYKAALQSHAAGSIVIEEMYWASEAEYKADLEANPVTPYIAPTKEIDMSGAKDSDWGGSVFNGIWLTGDFSGYDYLVYEIEDMNIVSWGKWILFGGDATLYSTSGSFIQVVDISGFERNVSSGMNFGIQAATGSTFKWKKVYFATKAYVEENGIKSGGIYGDTFELTLADLNAGWNAEYSADTKTITITGDADGAGGGKGWWFGTGTDAKDFSHFDNVVIEFESTTSGGTVMVDYDVEAAAPVANRAETAVPGTFGVGATCVVVPLDATNKSKVKSIQISGDKGSTYTLKAAYVAVASATPEAKIGTVTAVQTAKIGELNSGVCYNLAGQKINASYKGLVIKNGKKVVVK
jgi:hypothetical protein